MTSRARRASRTRRETGAAQSRRERAPCVEAAFEIEGQTGFRGRGEIRTPAAASYATGDTVSRGNLRRQLPQNRIRVHVVRVIVDLDRLRSLPRVTRAKRIERQRGLPQGIDDTLLVQEQLGEPPQRIAAIRKPLAQRHAVDSEETQRFNPSIRLDRRPFDTRGIETAREMDDLANALADDDDPPRAAHDDPRTRLGARPSAVSASSDSAAA